MDNELNKYMENLDSLFENWDSTKDEKIENIETNYCENCGIIIDNEFELCRDCEYDNQLDESERKLSIFSKKRVNISGTIISMVLTILISVILIPLGLNTILEFTNTNQTIGSLVGIVIPILIVISLVMAFIPNPNRSRVGI